MAIGLGLLFFYLVLYGLLFGKAIAPNESKYTQWWLGTWLLLSCIAILGSAAYYLTKLTPEVSIILALLTPPLTLLFSQRHTTVSLWKFLLGHHEKEEKIHNVPTSVWIGVTISLLVLVTTISIIASSATIEPLRSPWLIVPVAAKIGIGLAATIIFSLLMRGRERILSLSLMSLLLFTVLSVALFVFPIGFGFDAFIHRATETHIATFGTITPKPFYYIGQYALVLFINHAFSIPIELADTFLVPLLTALLLPAAWLTGASHLAKDKHIGTATLMGLFLLPLASFIVTTPQGLANLWTLLIILGAIPYLLRSESPRVWSLAIGALATLVIHPIAGIPAVLFISLIAAEPRRANLKNKLFSKITFWFIAFIGSIILPASFIVNAMISETELQTNFSNLTLSSIFGILRLDVFLENRFSPILDFAYLYGLNAFLILIIMAIIGFFLARHGAGKALRPYVVMIIILVINFLLLSTIINFDFLIDYERQNYAQRLIPLITFFTLPFLIITLSRGLARIKTTPISLKLAIIILAAAIATSATYLAYPRDDAYARSAGFNVSQADINTVYAIDDTAADEPYIVLANQSVSAAAIRSLGFKQYYGSIFFYPVPTGGPLYEKFLKMNDNPNRSTAFNALELTQDKSIRTLFFVVNKYWWNADCIIETAKSNADSWFNINGGSIYIFRYNR